LEVDRGPIADEPALGDELTALDRAYMAAKADVATGKSWSSLVKAPFPNSLGHARDTAARTFENYLAPQVLDLGHFRYPNF
jgi:hypothetical protein